MNVECRTCHLKLDTDSPGSLRCSCGSRSFAWEDNAEKVRTNYTPNAGQLKA